MHLENCDEVERTVLPEGELAAGVARDAAGHPGRCPGEAEHRASLLVGRSFHPLQRHSMFSFKRNMEREAETSGATSTTRRLLWWGRERSGPQLVA